MYNSPSQSYDVSPVSLSDFRGSGDFSPQYDDDHDGAVEDNDSKDEVSLCHLIGCVTLMVTKGA